MDRICVVGAGFSGAVLAHELASAGYVCDVFEARSHLGGNCHTVRDPSTGIMLHAFGPHIFHTDSERVWNFVRRFGEFAPFSNRVKAIVSGRVFSLPINLLTLNQFFGKTFSPAQARLFLNSIGDPTIVDPRSFEEQALRFVGRELYEAFFKGYTIKQWGVDPAKLPASILKRLPIRFNYDDNYYDSRFQGMPINGYTDIITKLVDHPNIHVVLNARISRKDTSQYSHTFYTGPLDEWFRWSAGRLAYRTLDFALERHRGDYQGNPVINYCDAEVPWTRICEHKYFSTWESHKQTVIFKEFSRECGESDVPFYPIRTLSDEHRVQNYLGRARREKNVTFVGRLATYRYLDMDVAIDEALTVAEKFMYERAAASRRKAS